MTGGSDPAGATGATGGAGSPSDPTGATGASDPSGPTGTSSGQPTDPPVNQDNVLGSWDSRFLHGTGGSWGDPGWMPDSGLQSLIGDLTSLIRDLTNILSSLVGSWPPDGENGHGMGSPDGWSSHGSVGGLDDGGKHHHHHHDMWRPDQY